MRVFTIQGALHKGKHIQVTRYKKHAAGVEIKIKHNVPRQRGRQLRWVQTIHENGSFFKSCKKPHYVDPFGPNGGTCSADDAKPFYWTDGEFSGGEGPGFYDKPSESPPAKGRTWIHFVTALVEVTGRNVHHLVAIRWGFDRLANGDVKESGIHRATMDEMRRHGRSLKSMYPRYRYT